MVAGGAGRNLCWGRRAWRVRLGGSAGRYQRSLRLFVAVVLGALLATVTNISVVEPAAAQDPLDDGLPGNGEPVVLARATWDTGWFQAAVLAQILVDLGYTVVGPTTTENEDFYAGVAAGEIDLWANGWFPLHDDLLDSSASAGARVVGAEVRGGALQGYLADRATVQRLGITDLSSLADPGIAEVFDIDDDGVADLIGCNDGWACQPIVDHHLDAYGLTATVAQVSGDYGPLMQDAVARFRAGQPVLFYTFTPNWTVGELVPGRDVVWLPVPFPSLPAGSREQELTTDVPAVDGCLGDPCAMGFPPNDIRVVANVAFLEANPAIEALLERFTIPLDDILNQNATLVRGDDGAEEIQAQAAAWISANRDIVDAWFAEAVAAHLANDRALFAKAAPAGTGSDAVGRLRVVTRLAAPFVTYDDQSYGGFSIDVLELVGEDIGADIDVYAVTSAVKLVDDVARGEAALGVGAIGITSSREEMVDFSQPYFESGLQILVTDRSGGFLGGRVGAVVERLFSRNLLVLIGVLLVLLTIAAHAIWLTERRDNPQFPESYRAGIWESFWWAAVTATTVGYGDKTPKGTTGRLFALLWMFSGLFVLAYFTAGIATAFTIEELEGSIAGPADLRGRVVAAPAESAAVEYLDSRGIAASEFPTADAAYEALLAGDVDAVVHDAAILQHFVATDARGGTRLTGTTFAERGFGFVLPRDSDLAERVNRSLLGLIESGEYDRVHDRWFGSQEGGG